MWISDDKPGIRRERAGDGFRYRDLDGRLIRKAAELRRIRALAIPPAYEQVWICPRPNGHLQATGRDARGRKQYRYHADWRLARDAGKFERMLEFGSALPRIRKRVQADLALPIGTAPRRETVLATLVRLLDTTLVRVGNDEYARTNRSFGLTTLHNRHADVQGSRLRLRFRGKSGIESVFTMRSASTIRGSRASSGAARRCPARTCSRCIEDEDWRRESALRLGSATSTTTSARPPAPTSLPRTSAPGTAAFRMRRWIPGAGQCADQLRR